MKIFSKPFTISSIELFGGSNVLYPLPGSSTALSSILLLSCFFHGLKILEFPPA